MRAIEDNVFKKIAVIVTVNDDGKKVISLSEPVEAYCIPSWSVDLTRQQCATLADVLMREAKESQC